MGMAVCSVQSSEWPIYCTQTAPMAYSVNLMYFDSISESFPMEAFLGLPFGRNLLEQSHAICRNSKKKTLYALNVFPLHVRASNAYKFQQITREDNICFMRCLRLSDQFFHFSSWNPFYCYCLHITTEYTYIDVYICSAYIMSTIVRCVWQYHVCVYILLYISMCMRQKR